MLKRHGNLLSAIVVLACSSAFSTPYYVAPNGSDGGAGTLAAPYKTVQKAASVMKAGDVCMIRAGIYRETVAPAASGTPGSPITFMPYQGENVFLSGADSITGWTQDVGGVWKAPIGWDLGLGRNQVFVNGEAMWEARYPELDAPDNQCGRDEYSQSAGVPFMRGGDLQHCGISPVNTTFLPGGLAGTGQENYDPRVTGIHQVSVHGAFFDSCRTANAPQSFLEGAIFMKGGGWYIEYGRVTSGWGSNADGMYVNVAPRSEWVFGGGCYFAFIGKRCLLDRPKEWVVENGMLYFMPPGGANPNTLLIEAKHRQVIVNLDGRSYINLVGLRFIGGSLSMRTSNNCLVDSCHAKYITQVTTVPNWDSVDVDTYDHPWLRNAENGIYIEGNSNTVRNSSFEYSAMTGLRILGNANLVTNCLFTNCNSVGTYECGVQVGSSPSGTNTVSYCTIYNMGRSGMSLTDGSGQQGSVLAPQKFLYNHVYNCQLLTNDGGTFYNCCEGAGWGTEIAYNWFHDMIYAWNAHHIYLDNGDGGFLIHHNVFWQEYGNAENNAYNSSNPGLDRCYNNTALQSPTTDIYVSNDQRGVNGLWANGKFDSVGFNAGVNCIKNRDFTLKSTSIAIDKGVKIQTNGGIDPGGNGATTFPLGSEVFPAPYTIPTDQWASNAPDLGAYESGKPAWIPGHTWGTYAWAYPSSSGSVADRSVGTLRSIPQPRCALLNGTLAISISGAPAFTVRVMDLAGRLVVSRTAEAGTERLLIPAVALPQAVFLMRVTVASVVKTFRVSCVR